MKSAVLIAGIILTFLNECLAEEPPVQALTEVSSSDSPLIIEAKGEKLPRQVMIEAKVVEMSLNASQEIGVDWVFTKTTAEGTDSGSITGYYPPASYVAPTTVTTFPPDSLVETGFKATEISFDQIRIGSGFLDAKIQAMVEKGEAEVLSNPRVATTEKKEANIVTGDKIPYQSAVLVNNQVVLTTAFETVGVKLKVTPTIVKENYILLAVLPEVSNVSGSSEIVLASGGTARLPVFSTRSVTTEVLVKDGQTFVLGGLYKNNKSKLKRGVPILSSIPILGFFFQSSQDILQKTDLVFFITPTIIKPGQQFVIPSGANPAGNTAAPSPVVDLTKPEESSHLLAEPEHREKKAVSPEHIIEEKSKPAQKANKAVKKAIPKGQVWKNFIFMNDSEIVIIIIDQGQKTEEGMVLTGYEDNKSVGKVHVYKVMNSYALGKVTLETEPGALRKADLLAE